MAIRDNPAVDQQRQLSLCRAVTSVSALVVSEHDGIDHEDYFAVVNNSKAVNVERH